MASFFEKKILPLYPIEKWPLGLRIKGLEKLYERKTGEKLDLRNVRSFNEKLQWYKLFYLTEEMKRCVDKVEFKNYIREKLQSDGYTAKLYGAWSDIPSFVAAWDSLPDYFYLKANIGTETEQVKRIFKKEVVLDELVEEVKNWLAPSKTLRNSFSSAYYGITPMILAEEALVPESSFKNADDIKVFCFNGEPYCLYSIVSDLVDGEEKLFLNFYDLSWKKLNVSYLFDNSRDFPKPPHLDRILELARTLSKDFPFARVDFYDLPDRVMLGEITFYPGGGLSPYEPQSFTDECGDRFVLPEPNVRMSRRIRKKYF